MVSLLANLPSTHQFNIETQIPIVLCAETQFLIVIDYILQNITIQKHYIAQIIMFLQISAWEQ